MFRAVLAIFCTAIVFLIFLKAPLWTMVVSLVLFVAIVAWGSFDIRQNFFLRSLSKQTLPAGKTVALTFDDGPTEFTPEFLALLKKTDAKVTFFCIGRQVEKHPAILAQIMADGHEIGNHTFSHLHRTGFMGTQDLVTEIKSCDRALQKAGNVETQLYRPPFGVTNPNIAKAVQSTGKISIGWNVRSLDTVIKDEKQIAQRVLNKIQPGSIVLMHDTSLKSLKALEILLLNLKQQGYRFVTVSTLLNLNN